MGASCGVDVAAGGRLRRPVASKAADDDDVAAADDDGVFGTRPRDRRIVLPDNTKSKFSWQSTTRLEEGIWSFRRDFSV